MSLNITIDRDKKRSLYQQIAEQIKSHISQGHLPAGTRLPTVRHLAKELDVTRLTVHNAYNELQTDGWVESVVGRGTFVAEQVRNPEMMAGLSQPRTPEEAVNAMASLHQVPGIRSLAYAYPDSSLLPVDDLWDILTLLREEGAQLMQYGQPQGDPQLRIEVAALLREREITAMPDDIIITSGVTQGLSMVTQALTKPGDAVLVETPTYLGIINILTAYGLRPIGVPRDEEGPRPDILEQSIIQQQPRFFYVIPTFHNPTGRTMTPARRREILALAERYGLLLVEDDIYCRLNYDGPSAPPLKAEDGAGRVIYLSGFSKDLLPGARLGYMTAPPPLLQRLPTLRGSMDLFGPPLMERAVAEFLRRKKFKAHLRRTLPIYQARRDAMRQSLVETMPTEVAWTTPQGGFACWVTLPADERLNDLYHAALQRGVAFSPGSIFMAQPSRQHHLRLCFGNQPVEVIRESVTILADLIRERIAGTVYPVSQPLERTPMV